MSMRNTTETYGLFSQLLHWLIALMVLSLLAVGWYMTNAEGPGKFQFYGLHKSFGAIVLVLAFVRVGSVILQPKPRILGAANRLQEIAAKSIHGLLYLWLIAMPLSGWVMSNAAGYPVKLFGQVTLPTLVDKSPELGSFAHAAHGWLAYLGAALLIVHVAAAIQHHFILKDDTLRRMLPGYRAPSDAEKVTN